MNWAVIRPMARAVVLAVVSTTVMVASAAGATSSSAASQGDVASARAATARFHDLAVATGAGYKPFLDCFGSDVGGMGQHYVNVGVLDGEVNDLTPEALVYEVRNERLKLAGVEYLVPEAFVDPNNPPSRFGHEFHLNADLGVWVLHAWIWQPNPLGMFEDFNPSIRDCPSVLG